MTQFQTRTTIAAPPERVWALLTDASTWLDWNPTVTKFEGTISQGAKVTVHARIAPGQAFPVTVSALEAPHRMEWTGGMPLGLFKGVRTFTLEADGDATVFTMHEVFTGLLKPLITRSMPDLQPEFEAFAEGLKAAAEA